MAKAKKKAKAKAKPAAKAKAKPAAKAKAKPATKAKAKPAAKAKAKAKPVANKKPAKPARARRATSEGRGSGTAVPEPLPTTETSARRRVLTARERLGRSSPVVEILDDAHPIGALRRFLEGVPGAASEQQAQIALGSAQLMLLPIAREHRGGNEVKELVDLVTSRWDDFGSRRSGFHAQEFLRNAFAAIGVDRDRIVRLEALVPAEPTPELRFQVACAYAVARDKVAMLRALDAAFEAGLSPEAFRRDPDFAPYLADPDFLALLAHAEVPPIPVDVGPYVGPVRRALESLISTLREFGEHIELRPPARLDAILDAERARKISLPNDYRALLTITNGMKLWGHEFFGAGDYREPTGLAVRAQRWQQHAAQLRAPTIADCIPLANWAQPNDWLVYDPRGRTRGGEPGYLVMADADESPVDGLAAALAWLESAARDILGTN